MEKEKCVGLKRCTCVVLGAGCKKGHKREMDRGTFHLSMALKST